MNRLLGWWTNLAPRERRLLSVFGGLLALLVLVLIPVGVRASLGSRLETNEAMADAIRRLQSGRAAVRVRQAKRKAMLERYATKAPELGGFLEKLAKSQALDVPDLQDKPKVPIGKRYVERSTSLRLRKVSAYPLLKFLEGVETSSFPVAVTRLNVHKRAGEHDAYDVDVGFSAFDRNEPAKGAEAKDGDGK